MDINYQEYHRDKQYQENEELFKNIFKKRFSLISKYIKSPKRVLDIGCSNGVFLDLYKGSETWGVEPSQAGLVASKKAHKVIKSYFEAATLKENYFDLIIMNHTLEHVKNAKIVLDKIYKLLNKDGILFVDVPNAGGLGSKLLGDKWPYKLSNEHTYQFTRKSLSKIAKDSGFNVLYWESRSGLFEFQNPWLELWQSLITFKKRLFTNLLFSPYSLITTLIGMGDSMSFVFKKV